MAEKKQRIVLKVTDNETGAEQISGEFVVSPGFSFCSCSSTSYSVVIATGPRPSSYAQELGGQRESSYSDSVTQRKGKYHGS